VRNEKSWMWGHLYLFKGTVEYWKAVSGMLLVTVLSMLKNVLMKILVIGVDPTIMGFRAAKVVNFSVLKRSCICQSKMAEINGGCVTLTMNMIHDFGSST